MAAGVRRQAAAALAACLAALLLASGAAARALQQADALAAAPAPSALDQIDPDYDPAAGPASDDMAAFGLAPAPTPLGPIAPPNALPIERSPVENSVQNCLADIGVRGVAKYNEDNREYFDPLRQEMVTRYDKARFVYNKIVDRFPTAVVYPANVGEVQQVIRCARKHRIDAVPRGGGHSYDGVSVQDNAIVVDMSAGFTDVTPTAADPTIFRVGSGVRLGPLYYALWQQGKRAIPGGTCPTVGAGGHILGGGYGKWSRLHGFVCDNLVGVEMVDTSGNVVTANRTYNSDLLWGCCGGGGNNFGVVTTFILQTFDASAPVTVFIMGFPGNATLDAIRVWQKWAPYADDRYTSGLLIRTPGNVSVQCHGQYAGPWAEAQKGLKESGLLDVPGVRFLENDEMPWPAAGLLWARETADITNTSYINLALPANVTGGLRRHPMYKEKSHLAFEPLSDEGLGALYDQILKAGNLIADGAGYVQISAYGGAIARLAPNATAFPHRLSRMNLQYYVRLESVRERQAALTWQRQTRARMGRYATNSSYINFLDITYGPDAETAYYGDNLGRMMEVKRKYDAANTFTGPLTFNLNQPSKKK